MSKWIGSALIALLAAAGLAAGASAQKKAAPAAKPAPKPAPTPADLKLRTKMTTGGHSFEQLTYIKGARQRSESLNAGGMVSLTQCDLKRTVQINDPAKTYMITSLIEKEVSDSPVATPAAQPASAQPAPPRRGGIVTTTMAITDTGERKEMFGFTARRIKTAMTTESSPEACSQTKSRMESDGWYIDFNYGLDCFERLQHPRRPADGRSECRDEYRTKNVGNGRLGYPVLVTTTMWGENGETHTMQQEVVELSRAPLEAALFEIPAGYTEAKDYQQLAGIPAVTPAAANQAYGVGAAGRNPTAATQSSAPAATSAALATMASGPKKPGMIRVGVVMPKAQMGQGASGMDVATPVRNTLVSYLAGPAIEIVTIDARIPVQIEVEAKQKECDYVLYTTVTQKQGGGGGFGGFLKKAAPIAGTVPMLGTAGSTAGAVAGQVATAAVLSAADLASVVKARDEISLEYRLIPAGGSAPKAANTLKAKAKSDGEDVLSPLIEGAAGAVLEAAVKK